MTYTEFEERSGMSREFIESLVHKDNMIEPTILDNFYVGNSIIHGKGFFTTVHYNEGDTLGKALVDNMRTELGRWVNHSHTPNVKFDLVDGDIVVTAKEYIRAGDEITVCYGDNLKKQFLIDYTPMEKMEIHIRSQSQVTTTFNTETKLFPNSELAVRQIKMKAGEIVIGKIHKEWNVNILASGSLFVTSDPTKGKVRVDAPYVFETGPGSQKFVMCITDCVFMNVLRSVDETEEEVVNRMAEDTRITKIIEKEKQCQLQ